MLKKAAVVFLICASTAMWISCVTTSNRFLYAALPQSSQIVVYREDPNSGILTSLTFSPITAGPDVYFLAIHPSRKFLYAANSGANNVSIFTIGTDASLTEVTPRPTAGTSPKVVVIDPAGSYLYVGNSGSADISIFSIDSSSGLLSQVGTFLLGIPPLNMKLSPSGNFLYVTGGAQQAGSPGYIATLSVSAGVLALTSITQPGASPYGLAIDPSGSFLYTANFGDNTISEFTINADGSLTELSGSPLGESSSNTNPVSLLIDNSGKYMYVANQQSAGNLGAYAIGSDGGLSLLSNSPFATAAQPSFIAADPSGKYLFVGNQSSPVIQSFNLDGSTGTLSSVASYSPGGTPTSIVITQ